MVFWTLIYENYLSPTLFRKDRKVYKKTNGKKDKKNGKYKRGDKDRKSNRGFYDTYQVSLFCV